MEDTNFIQVVDDTKKEPESVLTVTPGEGTVLLTSPNDEKMVYDIIDTEHPENNAVVDPDAISKPVEVTREEAFQRAAHAARILLAERINKRREKENLRAMKGRITKRRKKNTLEKASRKRNRG
jgi:hypothetical protein